MEAEDLTSSTGGPIVLDVLLLDLVDQVQRLVIEACIWAPEIGTLEELDLAVLLVVVEVEEGGHLAEGVTGADELLLDQG